MRKNPTTIISAGRGELLPTNPPPITPPISPPGGIKPTTPPVSPPGTIRPVTPPVILNPAPPGGSKGPISPGGFQIAPTGGPKSVKDVLTPKQEEPQNDQKKINPLFIYGGIALALYLLFK